MVRHLVRDIEAETYSIYFDAEAPLLTFAVSKRIQKFVWNSLGLLNVSTINKEGPHFVSGNNGKF